MSHHRQHSLDDYLSLYFVPDAEIAGRYVRQLLVSGGPVVDDPIDLLCEIIDEATVKQGRSEIVIPLTGGLDSRGLLGAALQVLPARAIHCISFGDETFPDVATAAATCERIGLSHQRIDPSSIQWDLAKLTDRGLAAWDRWHSLGPIDALAVYGAMADLIGDRLTLSGYLGGSVSGSRLPKIEERRNGAASAVAFLNKEHAKKLALTDIRGRERLKAIFEGFIDQHSDLVDAFPGMTSYDLLDLGFRQSGLIRSVAAGVYRECLSPYEDPRWIRHWMSKSVEDRLGGLEYRQLLYRAFPDLFPEAMPSPSVAARPVRLGRIQRLRNRFWPSAVEPMRPAVLPRPAPVDGRGDVRRNSSMAEVLLDAVTGFDNRQIVPDVSVVTLFQNLMGDCPTAKDFMRVRSAATAEMYLRAEVLT